MRFCRSDEKTRPDFTFDIGEVTRLHFKVNRYVIGFEVFIAMRVFDVIAGRNDVRVLVPRGLICFDPHVLIRHNGIAYQMINMARDFLGVPADYN